MKKKFVLVIDLTMVAPLLAVAPVSAGAIVTKTETEFVLEEGNFLGPLARTETSKIFMWGKIHPNNYDCFRWKW